MRYWASALMFVEYQLAHAVRNPNGCSYNRAAHLPERHKMMQEWVDYLDKLEAGAEIIPISQSARTKPPGIPLGAVGWLGGWVVGLGIKNRRRQFIHNANYAQRR